MKVMNKEALNKVSLSIREYLIANDWKPVGPNTFKVPDRYGPYSGGIYLIERAFKLQYDTDMG